MKLLYLTKSFAAKAGVERVLSDKMNWLAENGFTIMLVTYEQGNHQDAFYLHKAIMRRDLNARFFKLSTYSFLRRCVEYIKCRKRFACNLQQIVDEFKPDVLLTTTYQFDLFDLVTSVKSNSKKVLESHVACYKAQKSTNYSDNSVLYYLSKLYDFYFLRKVRCFDKLVTLTEGDANDWKKYNSNVTIIPNPLTYYPHDDDLENIHNTHRILSVGRLTEQKGFDMLIEAFSEIADLCPNWVLDIYGSGSDEEKLMALIAKYNMKKRVFINPATLDIYKEYKDSDFLVLASRYEGFGLVLIEAMSCRLPCVSFRCRYGPEDIITDGIDGLLVPNGNIKEMGKSILWMIQHEKVRVRMGYNARQSSARYKKEIIMKEWFRLFESI